MGPGVSAASTKRRCDLFIFLIFPFSKILCSFWHMFSLFLSVQQGSRAFLGCLLLKTIRNERKLNYGCFKLFYCLVYWKSEVVNLLEIRRHAKSRMQEHEQSARKLETFVGAIN